MNANAALAAAATLVAIGFGLSTLDRWLRRRRPHELAWTIALALFALGGASLWWAESHGWNGAVFRLFFLTGAILNVPWLALGTFYLLVGQHWGDHVRMALVGLSGLAAGIMITAPTKVRVSGSELPQGSDVYGLGPRLLAGIGSAVPAVFIVGGACWSAYRVLRHRPPVFSTQLPRAVSNPLRLVWGNLLIALGSIVLSLSGTFAGRLGKDRAFALTLLIGIAVLFVGFLTAGGGTARRVTGVQSDSHSSQRAA